ncbi:MAG: glycerol-3-phosphate transporter, partial [Betaproteobacteria bacterium]
HQKMLGTVAALTALHLVMATTVRAGLPPALVVILIQRWFVKGLVETEK